MKCRVGLTTQNLFFPDAHLVIYQAILLELITQLNELFPHGLHAVSTQQTRLCRLAPRKEVLCQILLFLTYG